MTDLMVAGLLGHLAAIGQAVADQSKPLVAGMFDRDYEVGTVLGEGQEMAYGMEKRPHVPAHLPARSTQAAGQRARPPWRRPVVGCGVRLMTSDARKWASMGGKARLNVVDSSMRDGLVTGQGVGEPLAHPKLEPQIVAFQFLVVQFCCRRALRVTCRTIN